MPSSPELNDLRQQNKSFLVIDVRNPDEVEADSPAEIQKVPLPSLEFKLWRTDFPKDHTLAFFCASGKRANLAKDLAMKYGYEAIAIANPQT